MRVRVLLLVAAWLTTMPAWALIRMVDASAVDLRVAAGSEAELVFELYNDADVADSIRFALVRSDSGSLSYLLTELSPCPQYHLAFPGFVALQPRQIIQCRYRLQRPGEMRSDATFSFFLLDQTGTVQGKYYRVGDLTRLSVSYRWLRFAALGQTPRVQVTVHNEGPTAVASVAYAGCAQLGFESPVRVVSGDCVNSGAFCFLGSVDSGDRDARSADGDATSTEWPRIAVAHRSGHRRCQRDSPRQRSPEATVVELRARCP